MTPDPSPVQHRFTPDHYETILESALAAGYRFRLFSEAAEGLSVYLRHDVDNSVEHAHAMARAEAGLGVRSTYLFLVRSPNYNPFTGDNVGRIRDIARMGHAVGLHFSNEGEDVGAFGGSSLPDRIRADAELLGLGVGLEVGVFSFHNPAGKDEFQIEVPGLTNTYGHRFFGGIKYLSESNFRWREGCPCLLFADRRHAVLQLLVHPMTYAEDLRDDRDALLFFLQGKLSELGALNQAQNASLRDAPMGLAELIGRIADRPMPEKS
ncbi:MAG TPA: hypothetical protein VED40_05275 [Azospirillaceae bacterium]|nr:hypothetical protein [Azospirillaceae bacterium]